MFSCKRCHGTVYLNMSHNMTLITTFSITQSGIRPGLGDLHVENKKEIIFYCPECKASLDLKSIDIRCCHCGEIFPVEVLLKPKSLSGVYCSNCFKEVVPLLERQEMSTQTRSLAELVVKMDLPR